MSEIYQQRLTVHQHRYRGRIEALREAVDMSVDESQFSSEEMAANLSELSEIARSEGMTNEYLRFLFDKVSKKEE